jgi:putative copper export protein
MNAAILVLLNNYVHDVSTGLLLISALWIGWSARGLGPEPSSELRAYFWRMYRHAIRFALWSLAVIIVTGVIRTFTFMEFEWRPAYGRGLIPILVLKHVLIFTMLGAGAYAWRNVRNRMRGRSV